MRQLLSFAVLFLLSGCATPEPYWRQVYEPYAEKYISVVRAKTYEELGNRCGPRGVVRLSDLPHGCTARMPGLCLIVLAPDADACTLRHERKHCAGWEHPVNRALARDCGDEE